MSGSLVESILANIKGVAKGWTQEVERRRKITEMDPVADTLEYTASELDAEVERLLADFQHLTPEQYAASKGGDVTAQTVRNWIKAGELEAVRGPRGWLIPASAERRKRKLAS